MSTLRINNIEAQSIPASPTLDEKVKITNSSGDILVNIDGKTSGITTIGINTTDGNIKFDANSNVLITGILTATTLAGNFTPDSLEIGNNIKLGNAGVITATSFVGSGANLTGITGTTINNNANDRVITGSGTANTLNGESGLTFNGSTMNLTAASGDARISLFGTEGNDARISLIADEGDDHIDQWNIRSKASNNNLTIDQFGGGTFNTRLTIDTDANDGDVIVNTGNLVIGTSGKGIDFSATPNGYAGSINETLDDYEEGYFTPTVGGWSASGTGVYGSGGQRGRYTKVGNLVTVFFHVYWTALNNASGVFAIENLPFAHSSSTYNLSTAVQMRYVDYSGDTVYAVGGNGYSSSLLFYAQNDNGNHNYVPIDSNGGRIEGTVTYLTDS